MKLEALHIGMKVRHPQYGAGIVKTIGEHTVEIRFDDALRAIAPEASGLQPAEAQVGVSGLEMPLAQFIEQVAGSVIRELGLERSDAAIAELAQRWLGGRLMMHPPHASLQAKEVPLEIFFHKIVMIRNNLRVLEQKINAHEKLSDADKVEIQQYITRCYGTMTTFNVLFKSKGDQFRTGD